MIILMIIMHLAAVGMREIFPRPKEYALNENFPFHSIFASIFT